MTATVKSDQHVLLTISELFQAFRLHDATMPLQLAHTFIICAQNEGSSIGDIAVLAGFPISTTSRHILDLGELDRKKEKPGLMLVETRIDPKELRRKTVHLTPKGRTLRHHIIAKMKG